MSINMRFVGDEPIASKGKDTLGLQAFIALLHDAVRQATTPFVFGVLGGWGTGKTSALRLLEKSFDHASSPGGSHTVVCPVWFNAWQYENDEDIVYPLIHTLNAHYLAQGFSKDETDKFQASFLKVVASSVMALSDLGLRILFDQKGHRHRDERR